MSPSPKRFKELLVFIVKYNSAVIPPDISGDIRCVLLDASLAVEPGMLIRLLPNELRVIFGLLGNQKNLGVREPRTKHVKLVAERLPKYNE